MNISTATKVLGRVFCLPFPIALTSWAGHPSSDLDQEVPPSGQHKDRDPIGTGGREGSSNAQESQISGHSEGG